MFYDLYVYVSSTATEELPKSTEALGIKANL